MKPGWRSPRRAPPAVIPRSSTSFSPRCPRHRRGRQPSAAPAGFVRDLFDGYAADYDRHLLGPLAYRAHRALVEPLPGIVGRTVFARALDLGCGTGLCGPLLRPFVSHLTGVDLSPRMLAEAAKSGAYDLLLAAEGVAVLEAEPAGSLDVVLAADVLIYIGDAEPLVRAAARALAPGGVLAFTVERLEGGDAEGHRLDPTLRFRHADALWPRLARRHGFVLAAMRPEVLRTDQEHPVRGSWSSSCGKSRSTRRVDPGPRRHARGVGARAHNWTGQAALFGGRRAAPACANLATLASPCPAPSAPSWPPGTRSDSRAAPCSAPPWA
jgi:predicted TPR repeat methyltransferase